MGGKNSHPALCCFDVRNIKIYPMVICCGYQDDPEYMCDAAIAHHADSIIYAGTSAEFGLGTQRQGIKKRRKAGIIVVRASAHRKRRRTVVDKGQRGWCLTRSTPAARVLLMAALTQTRNPELIRLFQYVLIMRKRSHPRRWAHR